MTSLPRIPHGIIDDADVSDVTGTRRMEAHVRRQVEAQHARLRTHIHATRDLLHHLDNVTPDTGTGDDAALLQHLIDQFTCTAANWAGHDVILTTATPLPVPTSHAGVRP